MNNNFKKQNYPHPPARRPGCNAVTEVTKSTLAGLKYLIETIGELETRDLISGLFMMPNTKHYSGEPPVDAYYQACPTGGYQYFLNLVMGSPRIPSPGGIPIPIYYWEYSQKDPIQAVDVNHDPRGHFVFTGSDGSTSRPFNPHNLIISKSIDGRLVLSDAPAVIDRVFIPTVENADDIPNPALIEKIIWLFSNPSKNNEI